MNRSILHTWLAATLLSASLPAEEALISKADALAYLRTRAILEELPEFEERSFLIQMEDKPFYMPGEVKGYKGQLEVPAPEDFGWQPWKLHLRGSFSDVLSSEDPSLEGTADDPGDKTFDDLDGATFSFARDSLNGRDTWAAQGALIAPLVKTFYRVPRPGDRFRLKTAGIVPSVSVFRISNAEPPDEDTDQVIYRVGVFGKWSSGRTFDAFTVRGFTSYATDLEQESETYAAELEWEPQIFGGKYLRLGYNTILWPQTAERIREDETDTSRLSYQLRFLVHGEIGRLANTGGRPALEAVEEQEFVRLGPIVHLQFKPFFFRRLSIGASYRYLPAISGHTENDSHFRAELEWGLIDPEDVEDVSLSLKVSYEYGGLDLTHEKADSLRIGLGAAF